MTEPDTRQAILDSAQKLFAQKGFAATSLRSIVREAGVNTAAIHYHFGSREALIEAVLDRLAAPVNRARREALDRLEARCPGGPLPPEDIVRAFITPPSDFPVAPRLISRAVTEAQETRSVIRRVMQDVVDRFAAAFARALPGVPRADLEWRIHFMMGALAFAVHVPPIVPGAGDTDGPCYERLIAFVTAGMTAPASVPAGGSS